MKQTIFKTISFMAVILSLFVNGNAFCQNELYAVSGLNSKESIVREYSANIFVVYNSGTGGRSFNLVDLNTMTVKSIDVSPLVVNDFEIYGDLVYYGGNVGLTGIVGWFDITVAFSATPTIRFAYLPAVSCPIHSGEYYFFQNVKKLELMDIGGGMHILLVGESYCTSDPSVVSRCLADVFYDGANWRMEVSHTHDGIIFYDDVAVTDNFVVPVGHKNAANGEYIYDLQKPTVPYIGLFTANTGSLVNHIIHAYGGYSCYIVDASSEYIIEHITGDIFATACYGMILPSGTSSYVSGTIFNLYNGVGLVNSRYCVSPHNYIYRDMRYNIHTNSVYLLPGVGSVVPNEYIEFFLDPTYTSVPTIQKHVDLSATNYTSLDACIQTYGYGQAILCGYGKSLNLWRHNITGEYPCSDSYYPSANIETCGQHEIFKLDIPYESEDININLINPTLSIYLISEDCVNK